jgi:hypothetical protein
MLEEDECVQGGHYKGIRFPLEHLIYYICVLMSCSTPFELLSRLIARCVACISGYEGIFSGLYNTNIIYTYYAVF